MRKRSRKWHRYAARPGNKTTKQAPILLFSFTCHIRRSRWSQLDVLDINHHIVTRIYASHQISLSLQNNAQPLLASTSRSKSSHLYTTKHRNYILAPTFFQISHLCRVNRIVNRNQHPRRDPIGTQLPNLWLLGRGPSPIRLNISWRSIVTLRNYQPSWFWR